MEVPISPSSSSLWDPYVNLLQKSLKSKDRITAQSIHARIIKSGLCFSVFLMNNLMSFYSKTGNALSARKLFDEMPVRTAFTWNTILSAHAKRGEMDVAHEIFNKVPRRDSVSWTSMIVGYKNLGQFEKGIRMTGKMMKEGIMPTQFTLTSVLASCAAVGGLEIGKKIHSLAVKLGLSSCVSVANSLLNMYAKCNDPVMAKVIFDRMVSRNISSWNAMIALHMQLGQMDLALAQFQEMTERDIVTWNSIITGYSQHGDDLKALDIFSKMLTDSSLSLDRFNVASALSACANLGKLDIGKQIHAHIIRTEFDLPVVVESALISMYSKSGGVETARRIVEQRGASNLNIEAFTALLDGYIKLGDINPARTMFDSLMDRDVIAWTAMIVGYEQNGLYNEAMDLFRSMVRDGPTPNSYTLAAMLSVTSSLASLGHGKQIHAYAIRLGEVKSVSVNNALMTMYAKTGSITLARRAFDLVHCRRDMVSWTSMIIALAQHGLGEEALELFEKMLLEGLRPDHITYVGILSACTHVGLVERGRQYFKMMKEVHNIEPGLSHYACIVDLLGRAGLLQEAYDFIQKMPIEPDVIAWGSLLSACRVHKNIELGKIAAERLLLIQPDNSGAYSALANLYSACGKWEEAAKIRKSMKDSRVKKDQGFSWFEVKSKFHVFGVADGAHPPKDEINRTMEKIWKEIKDDLTLHRCCMTLNTR